MKKKTWLIVLLAAVAVIIALTACIVLLKGDKQELVGTWMLYEGGYVAPEVLTFDADGTGVAYTLSDAYQDNSMADVQIPRSLLEDAAEFQWSVEDETLTFLYASGVSESLTLSYYTMEGVRMLSLQVAGGGGGWVPAEIAD